VQNRNIFIGPRRILVRPVFKKGKRKTKHRLKKYKATLATNLPNFYLSNKRKEYFSHCVNVLVSKKGT
jgi:hypothetical protein